MSKYVSIPEEALDTVVFTVTELYEKSKKDVAEKSKRIEKLVDEVEHLTAELRVLKDENRSLHRMVEDHDF
jgi:cell division protein FtsB